MDTDRMDGNVAAGTLADIFQPEITTAMTTCASCGAMRPVGELFAYMHAPGLVLRCPTCQAALMRLAETPGRAWLDLRGISVLEMEVPQGDQIAGQD